MITVILFIVMLAVLVFVHELGHFSIAKLFKIRVDEFGLGFPPRLLSKKIGETEYTLNAVPFGGFVKIFGENPDDESISGPQAARSFVHKPRPVQVAVLIAGIAFNIIFAWLLISIGFMSGMTVSLAEYSSEKLQDLRPMFLQISPGSPAELAGIKVGDVVTDIRADRVRPVELEASHIRDFIASHGNQDLTITVRRGDGTEEIVVQPKEGLIEGKAAIGVMLDTVGTAKLSVFAALTEGAEVTWRMTKAITIGLFEFIKNIFIGNAAFSQVTGPVGIAGMVGDARTLGFVYVLSFTAIISINLAIINLVPFPALDGGRILFVLIESVTRKRIKPVIMNTVNAVGFALLIFLMVVVTYKDIVKLF